MSGHTLNLNAIEYRNRSKFLGARLRRRDRLSPPKCSFFQQCMSVEPAGCVLGIIREFLVAAKHQDAGPIVLTKDLVSFYADECIAPHPFDLLSGSGESEQTVGFVRKVDRNNIRLVIVRTSQPAEAEPNEQITALFLIHLPD